MIFESRMPGLQVTLIKNISRTTLDGVTPVASRFSNANQEVDLTPYIGEHNGVRTVKSVRDPAGSFSITLTDQLFYDGPTCFGDSLYGYIEPMDSIEIRLTGDTYKSSGTAKRFPMMMRGFVSHVELSETMGSDGKPQRNIIVSGQDYGKILQQIQMFYMPGMPESDAAYMTTFPCFTLFGENANIMPASEFITKVINDVVNEYITAISYSQNGSGLSLSTITPDIVVSSGQVSPYGFGGWQGGTMYSLIASIGDIGSWNEFFIEDREDGPYAVYRPNPYVDVSQTDPDNLQPILKYPDGKFPVVNEIKRHDVLSISSARTDTNVANFFWVDCPRFNLNYESTLRSVAVDAQTPASSGSLNTGPYVTDYQNLDPTLYGRKKMWEATQQGGDSEADNGNGTPKGDSRTESETSLKNWITKRRADLIAQNKDNVIFETGTMRLKGNENIKAGTYIQYAPGAITNLYYVVSVEHDIAPFGNYFTTVKYERGTGFIGRISAANKSNASPYLAEMVDKS